MWVERPLNLADPLGDWAVFASFVAFGALADRYLGLDRHLQSSQPERPCRAARLDRRIRQPHGGAGRRSARSSCCRSARRQWSSVSPAWVPMPRILAIAHAAGGGRLLHPRLRADLDQHADRRPTHLPHRAVRGDLDRHRRRAAARPGGGRSARHQRQRGVAAMRRRAGSLIPLEVSILEVAIELRGRGVPEAHGFLLARSCARGATSPPADRVRHAIQGA